MGERKELRVKMVLPVRVSGIDKDGTPYSILAHTLDFSRLGARLAGIRQPLRVGETITLEYKLRRARFAIRWVGAPGTPAQQTVGVQSLEPENFLWLDVPQRNYTDNANLSSRRPPDIKVLAAKAAPESKPEGNDSSAAASNKTTPVENAIGSDPSPAPANEPAVRPGEPSASSGAHDTSNHDTVIAALEQRITAEGLPLDAALELVAGNAQRLLNGTGAAIAVPENDEMVCRASAGRAPAIGVHFRVKTGLTAEAMRSGRVVTCHNTLCDSRVDSELWRKVGIQSTISAPIALSVGGTAVLEVFAAEPNAFTSAHALLLEALSGFVSRMAAGDVNTCSRPATRSSEDG